MEERKHIGCFKGLYEVSNLGNVRSLDRIIRGGKGGYKMSIKGKLLKLQTDGSGYKQVRLCKGYKNKYIKVHRLVGKAFIDNPGGKKTINHINGIKRDNRVENLERATQFEQVWHYHNKLRIGYVKKEKIYKYPRRKSFNESKKRNLHRQVPVLVP